MTPAASRGVLALALALLTSAFDAASARSSTVCSFGGPTPGWRAMQINVPAGTEVQLRLTGTPPSAVGSSTSSHFVQAIGVVERRTARLVGANAGSWGAGGRAVVVRSDGRHLVQHDVPALVRPPVQQKAQGAVPPLRAGAYLVIAFGVDGDRALPNPAWGAELWVGASVSCRPVGAGELLDADHTAFRGGTGVSAAGLVAMDDAVLRWAPRRPVVFQVVQATAWPVGDARVDLSLPGGRRRSVADELVPLVARPGLQVLRASARGMATILVAGVALSP